MKSMIENKGILKTESDVLVSCKYMHIVSKTEQKYITMINACSQLKGYFLNLTSDSEQAFFFNFQNH